MKKSTSDYQNQNIKFDEHVNLNGMKKVKVKMILVVVWTSRCVCVDTIVKVILMFTNHDPKLNLFQMFTLNTSHVQQQLD